jgi:hypothetical protein
MSQQTFSHFNPFHTEFIGENRQLHLFVYFCTLCAYFYERNPQIVGVKSQEMAEKFIFSDI